MNWSERGLRDGAGRRFGLALLCLTVLVVACGGRDVASSGAPSMAARTPAPEIAVATAGSLVVDGQLMSILPARVGGVDMQFAAESAAGMMGDPELGRSASAIAVGIVVAAGESNGDDLAIASVTRLRPGVFSDAFYAAWRSAYDEAACAPAGGVASQVQRVIGSRAVEVTVCSEGARTYHTHLRDDVLVSVTAAGDRMFGDLVMAGLRE